MNTKIHLIPLRPAVAMLELVFAIIIIGIVLMSAPMVISTANKSSDVALQQEAISAAASEIGMILTYHWDEGDTDQNLSSPILTSAGAGDLNEAQDANGNFIGTRVGTIQGSKRSFLTSLGTRINATAPNALGNDANDNNQSDDIDDFHNNISALNNLQNTNTQTGDYIDNTLRITTNVVYISDILSSNSYRGSATSIAFNMSSSAGANPTTSNIKRITVNLLTTNTKANITLNAFACNIGTYKLEER
jgi:hypothetical protein